MMNVTAVDGRQYLKTQASLVEKLLDQCLPPKDQPPVSLHAAMRYSVMAGGKRLRPILALAAYEHCGGVWHVTDSAIGKAMAALEMVHTYSLIHDDLPCMDDDDLRRGQPTCHRKFGEALAVLAGDALHDVAFELMASTGSTEAVTELARAIGTKGMIGGQVADVEAEGHKIDKSEIIDIHRRKTAALIRCSVLIGAILAGADRKLKADLACFGEKVGLAFQIIDDILDIEGNQDLLGKKTGADSKRQKATYPGIVGMKQARQDAAQLIEEASLLLGAGEDRILVQIAHFIGQRER